MLTPNELTSSWLKAEEIEPCLEIGDLVEFRRVVGSTKRRIYTHWAVFIARENGKGYVAHLALEEDDFETVDVSGGEYIDSYAQLSAKIGCGSKVEVRRDELGKVARDDLCRINNSLDRLLRPFPPSIIVERAIMRLGTGGYNVLFNNCEHFVKYCRYGSRESDQATVIKSFLFGSLGLIATGSLPIALAAGCAGFALGKIGPTLKRKFRFYPDILT